MNEQQEQTMETMLVSRMEELKTKAKEIIDCVMGDLYTEYLPYVVSDTEANIGSRVDGVVYNLIAGKFERIDERLVKVSDTYQCNHFIHINNYDDLVKPLCAAMGADITNARIAQLEQEVKQLRSQLTDAYRRV